MENKKTNAKKFDVMNYFSVIRIVAALLLSIVLIFVIIFFVSETPGLAIQKLMLGPLDVGFPQIPGFLPENPLKNAEMALEDDYGMIDGIINNGAKEPTVAELEQQARSGQPISLMDLAAAAHREEREKKKSVMEQLKSQPKAEHKKIAPKKSAEREI